MEILLHRTFIIHVFPPIIKAPSALRRIVASLAAVLVVIFAASGASASQLVLNSTGGGMSIGTAFVLTGATVASPAGTIAIDCPITSVGNGTYRVTYNCTGGSFSYRSNDGTTTVSASFGTAAAYLTASGGGRGGHVHSITPSPATSLEPKPSMGSVARFAAKPTRR